MVSSKPMSPNKPRCDGLDLTSMLVEKASQTSKLTKSKAGSGKKARPSNCEEKESKKWQLTKNS